jgi:hypothetical protein
MREEAAAWTKLEADNAAEDAQWKAWAERRNLSLATEETFNAAIVADHVEALTMNVETYTCVECDATVAVTDQPVHMDTEHPTREIQLTVRPVAGQVEVIFLAAYPEVPAEMVAGHLPNGLPFTTVRVQYADIDQAWRMVDVLKREGDAWDNTVVKVRGHHRGDAVYDTGATGGPSNYRAHGFPSLDAANGASYAVGAR